MKTPGTKETIEEYEKKLEKILTVLPMISQTIFNRIKKTKSIKIDEEKFKKVLDIVLEIKSRINIPLNKNHLIFTDKEEFDPVEYKKKIIEQITTRG